MGAAGCCSTVKTDETKAKKLAILKENAEARGNDKKYVQSKVDQARKLK